MKKLKNGSHFININGTENFQITNPPKVWVSSFPSVNGNRISLLAIMKKMKNGSHLVNVNGAKKFQITDPPKVWVSGFLSVNGNGISASAIMKKLKNGPHFVNIDHMENFQITDPPPKFGFPVFQVSMETEYHQKMQIFFFTEFSIGSFFPTIHPRLHFNINAWLHLKHLCVDIYAWFTSHLCVVLHFLIFL